MVVHKVLTTCHERFSNELFRYLNIADLLIPDWDTAGFWFAQSCNVLESVNAEELVPKIKTGSRKNVSGWSRHLTSAFGLTIRSRVERHH